MKKHYKLLVIGVAATHLASCASLELIAAGGISYLLTGKGLSDHALSLTMDQDCATHRLLFDEPLCVPDSISNETPDVLIASNSQPPENIGDSQPEAVESEEAVILAQELTSPSEETAILTSGVDSIDDLIGVDLPYEPEPLAEIYAVVGSFNDLKYAFERSTLYRIYNTQIVEAPKDSNIRYRVVIGPLQDKGLIEHIPQKSNIDTNPHWAIELCSDSLLPPPCEGQLLVKK